MYIVEVVTIDGSIKYIDTVELEEVFDLQWEVFNHPADYGIECEINRIIVREDIQNAPGEMKPGVNV